MEREIKSESPESSSEGSSSPSTWPPAAEIHSAPRTAAEMRNTARVFVHVMDWFIPTSTAAGPPRRYTGSQISDTLRRIVKHDRSFMQLHAPADAVPPDLSEQEVDVACHEIEMAVIEAVRKYSNFFESPQGLQTLQKRLRSDDMEGYAARFTNDSAWTEVLSAVEGLFLHAFSVPWVDNSGAGRATGRVDHEQENVPVHASGIQTNSSERAVGEAMDHAWPLPATEAVSERESQAPQIGSTQMERQQQAIPPPHTEPRSSVQDMMSMQTAGVQCPVPSIQPLTSMMQALRQDMAAEDEKLTAAMVGTYASISNSRDQQQRQRQQLRQQWLQYQLLQQQ